MARKPLPKVTLRWATAADIIAFTGAPFAFTTRAMVGLVKGRIVGMGGIAYVDGRLYAFARFTPKGRRYKLSIVKAAAQVIAEAKANGARAILAEIDRNEPGAARWASSLGFRPTSVANIYRWSRE